MGAIRGATEQEIGTNMGIRFECPNGHRLHVKAFLAGKRGICPECEARFIVPLESGGRATFLVEMGVDEAAAPPPIAAPPIAAPPLPEVDLSQPEVWYVRPSTGTEQYGPADTKTMRGWAAEGRVLQESWVWRTGWPDWKKGLEVLAQLNAPAPTEAPPSESTAPIDIAAPTVPRTRRSSRRVRAKKITIALSALVVLLLAALALVLSR